jgi:hypothetical protein
MKKGYGGRERDAYRILVGENLRERGNLENLGVDGDNIKMVLQ